MSEIADFLDLRIAVGDFVGNRTLSSHMPRFTKDAERVLSRRLRTGWQIAEFAPAWTDNEAPLPVDFQEFVCLDNRLSVRGDTLGRHRPYSSPDDLAYYASLPTITTGPDGANWLLERYPNAYLYAVSVEAAKFMQDVEKGAGASQLLENELTGIKIDDERARYAHHVVRVRGCTP